MTQLLTTKLFVPPVRPELVPRPRLIEQLNAGLHGKLTLVSAPAGFGKTTLVAEWLRHIESAAIPGLPMGTKWSPAWLALDEDDNDPTRFLAYLIAALETVQVDVGASARALLQSPKPPPVKTILTMLINNLATVSTNLVLVLDDYHVIKQEAIHEALTFLLDHLPPHTGFGEQHWGMHLVIASRVDPPLPLSSLRARGQLSELRASDLRFTSNEAAAFLNQVMGLDLNPNHIAALEARTEGWIVGLQLAALSMQGRRDISSFIRAFAGSQHYILDYLIEEVLHRQNERVQSFLLNTSILERMSGPLCDAILDNGTHGQASRSDSGSATSPLRFASGQEILDYLDHANLFVVPLDDRQEWYRYHRLFADFLRARLHQTQPDRVPELHSRASAWYEQNGLMAEAIDHAVAAEDFERAAGLVEKAAEAAVMRSQFITYQGWIEALPFEVVQGRPRLRIYYVGTQLMGGRPLEEIKAQLQEIVQVDSTDSVAGEVAVLRALIATYQGDLQQSAELAQHALEILPEDSLFFRSLVAGFLGLNFMYNNDFVAARQALGEAVRIGQQVGNLMNAVLALHHLGEISTIQGQLHEAKVFYTRALEMGTDRHGRRQPVAGMGLIGLGHLLFEWNELEAAVRHLVDGIELVKQWIEPGTISGYLGLARARQALGDVDGAYQAIQDAWQIAKRFDAMEMDDSMVACEEAKLWLAQGNLEAAVRWADELSSYKDVTFDETPLIRMLEYVVLVQVFIDDGRLGEALELLETLVPVAESKKAMGFFANFLVFRSLAFQAQGNIDQALTSLERALSITEPQGYVRLFVGQGMPMMELLQQAAARGIVPDYVGKLLGAFKRVTEEDGGRIDPSVLPSMVEPLSERELEVLRLIAAGHSNREIAEELVVAISTIKTHINNVYRKLDVSSRTQAVARAQALGLL